MSIYFDLWKQPNTEIVRLYADAFDLNYHKSDEKIADEFNKDSTKEVIKKQVSLINASYHTRVSVKAITEGILSVTGLDTSVWFEMWRQH